MSFTVKFHTNNPVKRLSLALLLSTGLIGTITSILNIQDLDTKPSPDTLIMRSIDISLPPPPAPQSAEREKSIEVSLNLSHISDGAAMKLELGKVKTEELLAPAEALESLLSNNDWDFKWTQDWKALGISELDSPPVVLSPILAKFPKELLSRGINRAMVKLHIIIDELGRAHLKSIHQNPYPELKGVIQDTIKQVRFTVPSKHGKPVKAEFIWPVELSQ